MTSKEIHITKKLNKKKTNFFKKEYMIIFIIQITEVLGFSLILPFLPLYAEKLGASPLLIGTIFMTFSFFQFLSAPIMGKLSDSYGRKPLLMFSQISTFISFIILGFSNTIWMIFLSRIVDGILGSNFTIAQAYLSDISTKKDRSKVFGLSGAAFGVGFLIGPGIGGFLAQKFGYNVPAFIAAGVSLITIILTQLFLKETVKRKKDTKITLKIFHPEHFKKYFENKIIKNKILIFFSYILCHMVFVSTWALFAQKKLGFDTQSIGFILTYVGFNSVIFRGVLLNRMIDFFSEKKLQLISVISMITSMVFTTFINQKWMIYVSMTLFSFGAGILRPLIAGEISRSVNKNEQGAIMGVTNSVGSIAQILGPLIGGILLNYFIPESLTITAAIIMTFGLFLIIRDNKISENISKKS